MLGNKRYCYPLTVTDHASRYLLLCEAMRSNQEQFAFTAFECLFKERGLPQAIRSDNGYEGQLAHCLAKAYPGCGTRRDRNANPGPDGDGRAFIPENDRTLHPHQPAVDARSRRPL